MIKTNNCILNLQLFAEEKTEKATPKRRREAREKGQVIRSVEINSAAIILVSFYVMKVFSDFIIHNLKDIYISALALDIPLDSVYTYSGLQNGLIKLILKVLLAILPIISSCFIVGLVINYVQVGFLFTAEPLKPDLNRINPLQGFKRIFSKRAIYELIKSLLKLAIIIGIVYNTFEESLKSMPLLLNMQLNSGFAYICNQIFQMAIRCGFALLAMSVFDYFYQWWDYEKSLRMTKQEIKEEFKQTEGDPQVKGRIRELQRQMAMNRMMQEIPNADVIIVNPTHYAIALVYDPDKNDAPFVVAKGKDYIALKIKEKAAEHHIAIVENRSLAQALYNTTEIGQVIPPELYHAVAEVLAYVYSLKKEI
ncbi:MAG TPA: flagellar biosynthesis protein FlhB [Clostridiales bacterium]|nr:flagellar biosynthesis protein FlhB [Clostridiales bacterium]